MTVAPDRALRLVLLGPPVILLAFALSFAHPWPNWDDYYAVLHGVGEPHATFGEHATALLRQHNEHRIPLTRALAQTCYAVLGRVDLRVLIVAGNLGLIALAWIASATALTGRSQNEPRPSPWLDIAPVMLLMTSLHHWECITWAMASIQQFWSGALGALAVWLLMQTQSQRAVAGVACAVLATGANTNGLLVLPVSGAVWCSLAITRPPEGTTGRTALLRGLLFLGLGVLLGLLYLRGYHRPAPEELVFSPLQFSPWAPLIAFAGASRDGVLYLLAFLGSFLVVPSVAIAGGAGVLLTMLIVLARLGSPDPERRPRIVALALLAFVLASACLVAYGRASFGPEQAVSSRYRYMSLFALGVLWIEARRLDLFGLRSKASLGRLGAMAMTLLAVGSLVYLTSLSKRRAELIAGQAAWHAGEPMGIEHLAPPDTVVILRGAVERGIFPPAEPGPGTPPEQSRER